MEEKKKKKQEEKKKKEAAHKKAADQKAKAPDSAKLNPSNLHPANTSASSSVSSINNSGNGKRPPATVQQQQLASPRFPPREVPPRFRQHEHKQLLKRGQPLPTGTLSVVTGPTGDISASSSTNSILHPSPNKQHSVLQQPCVHGVQYENSCWGQQTTSQSETNSSSWDQVIIDQSDTEAWPSISGSDSHVLQECIADTDCATDISNSMNMASGGGQQGHFLAHHPNTKSNGNHSTSMASSQGGSSRGWASGPTHCPSVHGSEDKTENISVAGRGQPCWSSNFNLNLNPNANPAAWPVLGHEGSGMGSSNSTVPPPTVCSPVHTPQAQVVGSMNSPNGNSGGSSGSNAWGSLLQSDTTEQRSSQSTNVSFSIEPQNLNTDGPNNTKQQPLSPIHGLPSWGSVSVTMGSLVQQSSGTQQVNGEGNSVWGNGDNGSSSPKDSAWDSGPPASSGLLTAWGRAAGGGGNGTNAWGRTVSSGNGDWDKHSSESKGWNSLPALPQEQSSSWMHTPNAPASEGSSDSLEGRSQCRERSAEKDDVSVLPRQDLDPRVLCNTGWGQTPVRQHTVWEIEELPQSDRKNDNGTEAWGTSSSLSTSPPQASAPNTNPCAAQLSNSGGKGEGSSSNTSVISGWGSSAPAMATSASSQPVSSWGETVNKKAPNGPGGWGDPSSGSSNGPAPKGGMSWSPEEKTPNWDDHPSKPKPQTWGEGQKANQAWTSSVSSGNGGEWGEPGESKKNGPGTPSWESENGWKEHSRGSGWGKQLQGVGAGWAEAQRPSQSVQNWSSKPQDSGNVTNNNVGSWGGAGSVKQSGTGWGGEITGGASGGSKLEPGAEPTGWEEPSPPSVRRKMEIDDGTSAWGDPSTYKKTVNMWDRNTPVIQSTPAPCSSNNKSTAVTNSHTQSHSLHHGNTTVDQVSLHPPSAPQNRPGWGDLPSIHSKPEPSWGEPASPAPAVDNGTSAWGKPPGGCGGWGDNSPDPSGPYGRVNIPSGSAPCKPASKSMQDGWGSAPEELSVSAGQWDQEEGDIWNSTASQESNSSCNSWGTGPKTGQQKSLKASCKQDDAWLVSRLIKQLTDMGFPREPAEEALKSNNMNLDQAMSTLLEKKTEMDKRGMEISEYNGLAPKTLGCRPTAISKESSSERAPFIDKDGSLGEDTPSSPFLPSPNLKLSLSSSALPSQSLGGVSSGLAVQNLNSNRQMQSGMFGSSSTPQTRAMPQQQTPAPPTSVPPLNSSQPSLRAQVPQFLSPQVQAQLLQFAAKNIGLNPALLTSPMNPQHMTLLNQLYQLQLTYQRLQIQQQMLQAQRNVSGPMRQQEQQVARTINNMQQQIQQHQRQLAQALLLKQQPSHPSLHSSAGKSTLESFQVHPQAAGLSDLQTKEHQTSTNSYPPYPISGLNPTMNVNNLDMGGGLSMKDSQSQSRLPQWTHPNSVDNLQGTSSALEQNLSKHGMLPICAIPVGPSVGASGKPPIDDSYSPYNLIPNSESPASPLVAPDSWTQAKSANEKISNGTNVNWPPEFCPGVPWKGLQNIDPETDPNVTPGSVPSGPTINTNIQDVNRYLLRDRNAGKLSDMKSTWSPGSISHSQASLSHELWKVPQGPRNTTAPTRPPPGLTNAKPTSTWGGNSLGLAPGWNSSYSSTTTWSTDSSGRASSWLVLRNLTPQIDGSTLRTLCMQHGPLITFHLNLTQGNAVVRYSSKEEAAKAQKSLHMCVLGNTTILAEFAGEEDVNRFFAQGQSLTPTTNWQANVTTNQARLGTAGASHGIAHWNSAALGSSKASSELLWGGVPQYSSLWGPPGGEDTRVIGSPTQINTLLPGDLLSGESM
ncbi:trinucleotide repeat-containing gene 6C protein isoform X1 [Polypterus senegalus]|uniref:trinucleotide repeat-containing gene 6C protein isoform X1 n=1 Tax=Polypterus senegalus TaxID=55291 RepID=UPI0019645B0B|nr:trinucleotide repeat-containing gene 6C protein isoform X1 [Polypterus senegalus]